MRLHGFDDLAAGNNGAWRGNVLDGFGAALKLTIVQNAGNCKGDLDAGARGKGR